ncbi:hypothetical protein AKJ16_DCAP18021 [Drosera capensis]
MIQVTLDFCYPESSPAAGQTNADLLLEAEKITFEDWSGVVVGGKQHGNGLGNDPGAMQRAGRNVFILLLGVLGGIDLMFCIGYR